MSLLIFIGILALANSSPTLIGNGKFDDNGIPNLGIASGSRALKMKPYLCSIYLNDEYTCVCSILDESTVLTAATCYSPNTLIANYKIGTGNVKLSDQIYYRAKEFVIHENFDPHNSLVNNIAIIKLAEPIHMIIMKTHSVQLVEDCEQEIGDGQIDIIAGWGSFDESLTTNPNLLYETKVTVLNNKDPNCSVFASVLNNNQDNFCVAGINGQSAICAGDFGGPIVNQFNEQFGIASSSNECGSSVSISLYTNLCAFKDWLQSKWKKST